MLIIIDNYDSFTYNIYQLLGQIGVKSNVIRNDRITVAELKELNPEFLIISPGPRTPREAGISLDVIGKLSKYVPTLGICLGHQAIGHYFGARVIQAKEIVHGKASKIFHDGKGVFQGLPVPFNAIRYHSLVVERDSLPDCLEITAEASEGEIMGLRHKEYPIEGVQFHPESILTDHGIKLISNFLNQ